MGPGDEGPGTIVERSPVPLYHRIKDDIAREIADGRWLPGKEIPSEVELGRRYSASRGTVRRAVTELERAGLVEKIQGRGTYVRGARFSNSLLASYQRHRAGGAPFDRVSQIRTIEKIPAEPRIAEILQLPDGAPVYYLVRVRVARGLKVSREESWLPVDLCDGLDRTDLSRPLYPLLQQHFGLYLIRAQEVVRPVLASAEVAADLEIEPGAAMFAVERTSHTHNDRVGEYREAKARGDVIAYRIDLR